MSRSGWIVKEGGRYKSWKKRFAVIEGNNLAYYKKEVRFNNLDFIILIYLLLLNCT